MFDMEVNIEVYTESLYAWLSYSWPSLCV